MATNEERDGKRQAMVDRVLAALAERKSLDDLLTELDEDDIGVFNELLQDMIDAFRRKGEPS